jgi:hypothetical protein
MEYYCFEFSYAEGGVVSIVILVAGVVVVRDKGSSICSSF